MNFHGIRYGIRRDPFIKPRETRGIRAGSHGIRAFREGSARDPTGSAAIRAYRARLPTNYARDPFIESRETRAIRAGSDGIRVYRARLPINYARGPFIESRETRVFRAGSARDPTGSTRIVQGF